MVGVNEIVKSSVVKDMCINSPSENNIDIDGSEMVADSLHLCAASSRDAASLKRHFVRFKEVEDLLATHDHVVRRIDHLDLR